jgi:hypothetical protein
LGGCREGQIPYVAATCIGCPGSPATSPSCLPTAQRLARIFTGKPRGQYTTVMVHSLDQDYFGTEFHTSLICTYILLGFKSSPLWFTWDQDSLIAKLHSSLGFLLHALLVRIHRAQSSNFHSDTSFSTGRVLLQLYGTRIRNTAP